MKAMVLTLLLLTTCVLSIKLVGVEFSGLKTVPESSLTVVVEPFVGMELTSDLIGVVKNAVMDIGYFEDVRADLEDATNGMILVLKLNENPVLKDWKITVEGPELLNTDDLATVVRLEKGIAFNTKRAYQTLMNIKRCYESEGYHLVEVNGNFRDGIYEIKVLEYAVWDLVFRGETEGLDPNEIKKRLNFKLLKDYYSMNFILRFFVNEKDYYPKLSDIQRLLYQLSNMIYFSNRTRLDFEKVEVEGVKEHLVNLVLNVEQRRIVSGRVKVNDVELKGVRILDPKYIKKEISWLIGDDISNFDILRAAQRIIDLYDEKGYPMVWVIPEYRDGKVIFSVVEKYVSDVEYKGLEITKKYLVDDLVTIEVGKPLSRKEILETYGNLKRSEYFENVDIIPLTDKESTDVRIVLNFKEKEKKFQFVGGVAWSPPKEGEWWMGFGGQLSLKTVNPWGFGQSFSVSLNLGLDKKNFNFEYSIPRPGGEPMKFGSRIYYTHTFESTTTDDTEISTTTHTVGTWLDLSTLPIYNNTFSAGMGYELEIVNDEPNNTLKGRIGHVFDNRDSALNPKRGFRTREVIEKAGLLGLNSKDYLKITASLGAYGPLYGKFFWAFEGFIGGVDVVKGDEEIKLAYANSIRGYPQFSGRYAYRISLQLKYSVMDEPVPINALVFYDTGDAVDEFDELFSDRIYSYGLGMEFVIPVLTRVEVGYGYKSESDSWDLYFVLGAGF